MAVRVVAAGLAALGARDAEIDRWVRAAVLPTIAHDLADPSRRLPAAAVASAIAARRQAWEDGKAG